MASEFGKIVRVSVFGQSHGEAIGLVADGLPAGEKIDMDALNAFMARRRGGQNPLSTARKEADEVRFVSGVLNGVTCASPLCAIIENTDAHSADYALLSDTPRPGHADYPAYMKWRGYADMRGGGHFSGRLTAPLCVAGGIAGQMLRRRGIYVGAHLYEVAEIRDAEFPLFPDAKLFDEIAGKPFPVINDEAGERMQSAISAARAAGDSVGGIVELAIIGLPAGIGSPMFEGVESRLSAAIFGIPAVKGVEFGAGFQAARLRGGENNDPFRVLHGRVTALSNHAGGILGGITTGMPVVMRAAFKPTPSIALKQDTVRLGAMENARIAVSGRHDPCIAPRAVPVVEAVAALVALDLCMEEKANGFE